MADNSRDVSLKVAVSTDGAESIRKLSEDVKALAKEGGDAAPEFNRLATELDRLAEQTDALQAVKSLSSEVEELAAAQKQAADTASQFSDQLRTLETTTLTFRDAEAQARAEVRAAQNDIADKRDALARLKLEYDDAGKKTADYKRQVETLSLGILDAKSALRDKREALRQATEAAVAAGQAEKTLASESRAANAEAQKAAKGLQQRNSALAESRDALQAAGVGASDLAAAQTELLHAFDRTTQEVSQQQEALVKLRQAEADAAEATRAAAAEEDRLAKIQFNNRYRLEAAAREQLEAEKRQYAESAALAKSATDARIAAEQRWVDFTKASAQARQSLDDAFAKTGVRSAQSVQREINEINTALVRLANDASVSGADFDRAFAAAQRRIETLKGSLNGVPEALNQTSAASRLVSSAFGQLTAAYGAIELGQKFINANVQLETLRRSLAITTGSTQEAARQIDFLRDTANRSGVAIGEISDSFLRFSVSASQAGISTKVVEEVFAAVTRASGQMGLSSERASLALEALSQMAGKGVVSMEELRGQLGDSLPGALKTAADGLGLTVKELTDMVEKGQVMSKDMLPALASALTKTLAKGTEEVSGFQATWNRLKNTMTEASQTIGDTGALQVLTGALRAVGVVAGSVAMGVSVSLDTMFTAIRQGATLVAGVVQGDFKNAVAEAGRLGDEMINRQAKLGRTLQALALGSSEAAKSQGQVGAAAQQAGAQAAGATAGHEANAQAQQQAAASAGANAQAQGAAGAAAAQAGAQATGAAPGWYLIQAAYKKVNEQAEANTLVSEKLAAAKKLEGETSVQLATLAGNEIELRRVAAVVAADNETATQRVAAARQQEVIYLKAQVESLNAAAAASGGLRDDQAEQVKVLTDLITKKEAEAEKAKQAADAAAGEANARRLAVEVYRDNAAALDQLRKAALDAKDELQRLQSQQAAGTATQEEVAASARGAAAAEALYHDALDDTARAAARKVASLRQDASETEIGLRLRLAAAKTQEREAELYGLTGQAIDAKIKQKRIEIDITRAHIEAVNTESKASIAAAEAERAELAAKGELTPAKQEEIDLRIRNAEAKQLEAQAGEQQVRQLQLEIDALRARNTEASDYQRAQAEGQGGAQGGRGGNRLTVDQNDALASLVLKQQAGELGGDDLKVAQAAFQAASFNRQVMERYRAQFSLEGAQSVETAYNQARTILEQVQLAQGKTGAEANPQKAAQPAARTVNLNINGKSTPVNVASEADANNLVGALRQLESMAGRSNV